MPTADQSGLPAAATSRAQSTQQAGKWLAVARAAWAVFILVLLTAFCVEIPFYQANLSHACAEGCGFTEKQAATLSNIGISLSVFSWVLIALSCLLMFVSLILALILFLRRSRDWMAMLVSVFLIAYPLLDIGTTGTIPAEDPSVLLILNILTVPAIPILFATFLLFPDGRFVPRWAWIVLVVSTIWETVVTFFPDLGFLLLGYPVVFAFMIAAQVVRYRRHSTPVQRQQTKWAVAGLVIALAANQLFWVPSGLTPLGDTLFMPFSYAAYQILTLALPISFFVAIQRHRLYEIDTIINRALVYGSVTLVLATIYAGCIVAFQGFSRSILPIPGGSDQPLVIIISTLLIAALFQPLRRRIQRAVDRRFYRTKYDARKAVEAFGMTLQQDVDIDSFQRQLLLVVQQTMEPAHLSLWLNDTAPRPERAE